jgi:hypothetical protein
MIRDGKPYEVCISVFRRYEYGMDDVMLANTCLRFATIQEAVSWCDKAGVCFK